MKRLFLFFAFMMGLISANAQNKDPEFVQNMHSPWVDSVFNSLSLKEQIGQMIFVELRPSNPSTIVKALDDAQILGVGGAVLFKSTLPEAAALTNGLQGFYRGMGKMTTTLIGTCLQAGLRAAAAAVLAPRVGLPGIAFACAFGWCVMLAFEVPYYFWTCKKQNLKKASPMGEAVREAD